MKNLRSLWTLTFILPSLLALAQAPTAKFSFSNACEMAPVSFVDESFQGSNPIVEYSWDFGDNSNSDTSSLKNPSYTFDQHGSYWVKLVVTNNLGFSDSISRNIIVHAKPQIEVDITVPCFPFAIQLIDNSTLAEGTIVYREWSIDGTTNANAAYSHAPALVGTYAINLDLESDKSCSANYKDTIEYTYKPVITFTPAHPAFLCEGKSVELEVAGASDYLWDNGTSQTSRIIIQEGTYSVVGTNSNACFTEDSIEVREKPNPIAEAGEKKVINVGESIKLDGSGGQSYSWNPSLSLSDTSKADPIANPTETTMYRLTVWNEFGCSDQDSVVVKVIQDIIPVHNFISPNNDGKNDVWDLRDVPNIDSAEVFVFNRWGWEVFHSEQYDHQWDGNFKGSILPDGTYVYIIKFYNPDLGVLKGSLEIARKQTW